MLAPLGDMLTPLTTIHALALELGYNDDEIKERLNRIFDLQNFDYLSKDPLLGIKGAASLGDVAIQGDLAAYTLHTGLMVGLNIFTTTLKQAFYDGENNIQHDTQVLRSLTKSLFDNTNKEIDSDTPVRDALLTIISNMHPDASAEDTAYLNAIASFAATASENVGARLKQLRQTYTANNLTRTPADFLSALHGLKADILNRYNSNTHLLSEGLYRISDPNERLDTLKTRLEAAHGDFNPQPKPTPFPAPNPSPTPTTSPSPTPTPIPESIQTNDGFRQFTDADDSLTGQADIKLRMLGGDDSVEIIDGNENYVNGNEGKDRFKVLGGAKSVYLGGRDADTFEVLAGIDNYFNGQAGDDKFVIRDGRLQALGGDDNDLIEVIGAKEGSEINGNKGKDTIAGSAGITYRGGADDDLIQVSQGDVWGDKDADTFVGVAGDGYAVIQDYTIGEDLIEISMDGNWSKIESGLMFTDNLGDQIMLLVGINDLEQVTLL